ARARRAHAAAGASGSRRGRGGGRQSRAAPGAPGRGRDPFRRRFFPHRLAADAHVLPARAVGLVPLAGPCAIRAGRGGIPGRQRRGGAVGQQAGARRDPRGRGGSMRLLMLGINYWPEETGIAVFSTGRCEYMASRGHATTIATGFPYYPRWRIDDAYRGRLTARQTRNGVEILRSYLYVPRHVTTLGRIVHEASFVASSCLRAMK